MTKIDITEKDIEVLENALTIVSGGNAFGKGSKRMKVNTLKGIFDIVDGLRDLIARAKQCKI